MLVLYFLSPPNNSDESVHTNVGGSFSQSENASGHLHISQWKAPWFHQVRAFFSLCLLLAASQSSLTCCWLEQVGDKCARRSEHPRVQKLWWDIHRSEWLHSSAQQRDTQGDTHLCYHLQRGGVHWQRHPWYSVYVCQKIKQAAIQGLSFFFVKMSVCSLARRTRGLSRRVWRKLVHQSRECPAELSSWRQPIRLSVSVETVSTTTFRLKHIH